MGGSSVFNFAMRDTAQSDAQNLELNPGHLV